MRIFVSISSALLVFSFSINAETIESVEYKYYEISPRTPYEIKPELMRRSPIREGGGTFNGHTDWYVSWKYQSGPGPYGCQLNNIQTTVHVVHTLPVLDRKSTRLNSSHQIISYAVFCLKKNTSSINPDSYTSVQPHQYTTRTLI